MCEFPSWIEEESGKVWFLTDADIEALIEAHGGIWEDYIGHAPLRKYFHAEGRECESVNIHPKILLAIMEGKMTRMAKVSGYDIVAIGGKVKAKEGQKVLALGWSEVEAWGNSKVVARGNSEVEAWGNSKVEAWENSEVVARENSEVVARGNSKVEAWGNSKVEAWENSKVVAQRKNHKKQDGE